MNRDGVEPDLSALRAIQRAQQREEGRLPRPGWAGDGEKFTPPHLEMNILEHLKSPIRQRIGFAQVLYPYDRLMLLSAHRLPLPPDYSARKTSATCILLMARRAGRAARSETSESPRTAPRFTSSARRPPCAV